MQCKSVIKINVLTSDERLLPLSQRLAISRPFYRPCGKCYACQCRKRAEWAFRAACELEALKHKGMTVFVTLTYANQYLPTIFDEWSLSDPVKIRQLWNIRDFLISREQAKPFIKRRWNFCRLHRPHFTEFMSKMQKEYKKLRFKSGDGLWFETVVREYYDKSKGKVRKRKYLKPTQLYLDCFHFINFRVFGTGEYGTFTNRCHFHILFFVPFAIVKDDFENMCKKCWQYGNVDIDFDFGKAAINYVAKHQVKDDSGCKFQGVAYPPFKSVSVFQGGLGIESTSDPSLYARYLHVDADGNYDRRFFEIKDERCGTVYKIPMPEFYLNKFWERYCQENNRDVLRSDWELDMKSQDSEENFKKFLVENDIINNFVDKYFTTPQEKLDTVDFMKFVFDLGMEETNIKRLEYKKKRLEERRYKIMRGTSSMKLKKRLSIID